MDSGLQKRPELGKPDSRPVVGNPEVEAGRDGSRLSPVLQPHSSRSYWALLKLVPVPGFGTGQLDSLGNITACVDRFLLGANHLWPWGLTPGHGVTFDPEGLLSTLPAIASLLFGVIAGEWLLMEHSKNRNVLALAGAGLILALALSPCSAAA